MPEWYRNWRRDRILKRHGLDDRSWESLIQKVPAVLRYDARARTRLREMVGLFLYDKSIEPAGNMQLDEETRHLIALQACIPVLSLGLDWYEGWRSVVVYPGDFEAEEVYSDEDGVVHEVREARSGEAWPEGPVVISWTFSDEDANVIIHEFAHKLDLCNGTANGMPPLHSDMDRHEWTEVFTRAYDDFCARVDRGMPLPFDAYAATDAAEFFAVASEAFLLMPDRIRDMYPRVYTQLCAFYRQHPRAS